MKAPTSAQSRFVYRPRTYDNLMQRSQQSASGRESYVKQSVKFFTPKDGMNRIRILPPTWANPEHYGYDLFVHFGVGPDKASYLCNMKHKEEPCYSDEILAQCTTDEERNQIRAKRRVGVYLIDRDRENEGVLFWALPWGLDRDILLASADPGTREVYAVDDPVGGYDVHFTKTGQGIQTKYAGVQVARKSSPLHVDAGVAGQWLDFAVKNPIPSILQYYDYDHVKKVATGGLVAGEGGEAPVETPQLLQGVAAAAPVVPNATTVEMLKDMELEQLFAVAEQHGVDMGSLNDRDELEAAIAQAMGIAAAPSKVAAVEVDPLTARFQRLKNRS